MATKKTAQSVAAFWGVPPCEQGGGGYFGNDVGVATDDSVAGFRRSHINGVHNGDRSNSHFCKTIAVCEGWRAPILKEMIM